MQYSTLTLIGQLIGLAFMLGLVGLIVLAFKWLYEIRCAVLKMAAERAASDPPPSLRGKDQGG